MKLNRRIIMSMAIAALLVLPLMQTSCKKDEDKEKKEDKHELKTVPLTVDAKGMWVAYQLKDKDLNDNNAQKELAKLLTQIVKENIKSDKGKKMAEDIEKLHMDIVELLKGLQADLKDESKCEVTIAGISITGTWEEIEHGVSLTLEKPVIPEEKQKNETLVALITALTQQEIELKSTKGTDLVLRIKTADLLNMYYKTDRFKAIGLTEAEQALLSLITTAAQKKIGFYDISFKKKD